eukprot:Nk52_evm1s190 gene=Nk52_evmTU1s190
MAGGKKKGKGKGKGGEGGGNKIEVIIAEHGEMKKELEKCHGVIAQLRVEKDAMGAELREARESLGNELKMKTVLGSDMTRQYKSMKMKMIERVNELETETADLRNRLESTQDKLSKTEAAKADLQEVSDREIEKLNVRLSSVEAMYEQVIVEALDVMARKMEEARNKWEDNADEVQQQNREILEEFGLGYLAV